MTTPRNIAIMTVCVAVAAGVFAFWVGYSIGSRPQTIIVHLDAPLLAPDNRGK